MASDDPAKAKSAAKKPGARQGGGIVRAVWWATAGFTVVALVATVSPAAFGGMALVVDVALFLAGCVLGLAFLRAADRSRTEAIGIGGLFFLAGDVAPPDVRLRLVGALAAQTVVALVTAGARLYTNLAAGIFVPVLGLGLCGLWGARYGRFDPRTPTSRTPTPTTPTPTTPTPTGPTTIGPTPTGPTTIGPGGGTPPPAPAEPKGPTQ